MENLMTWVGLMASTRIIMKTILYLDYGRRWRNA